MNIASVLGQLVCGPIGLEYGYNSYMKHIPTSYKLDENKKPQMKLRKMTHNFYKTPVFMVGYLYGKEIR